MLNLYLCTFLPLVFPPYRNNFFSGIEPRTLLLVSETESYCVTEASLKFNSQVLSFLECSDYRHVNLRFILSYSFEAEKFKFGLPWLVRTLDCIIAREVAGHLHEQSPVHIEEATHMRYRHCLARFQKN